MSLLQIDVSSLHYPINGKINIWRKHIRTTEHKTSPHDPSPCLCDEQSHFLCQTGRIPAPNVTTRTRESHLDVQGRLHSNISPLMVLRFKHTQRYSQVQLIMFFINKGYSSQLPHFSPDMTFKAKPYDLKGQNSATRTPLEKPNDSTLQRFRVSVPKSIKTL